jgi:hypothetical protein
VKKFIGFAAIVGSALATLPAQAQILLNGNFQSNLGSPASWTSTLTPVTVVAYTPLGNRAAEFAPSGIGSLLTQSITGLTFGEQYRVSFGLDVFSAGTYSFSASAGAGSLVFSGVSAGPITPLGGSFVFAATGTSQLLSFSTPGTPSNQQFLYLDNVTVQTVPGPLPLLGAAAAFGWSRKIRRRIKDSEKAGALA